MTKPVGDMTKEELKNECGALKYDLRVEQEKTEIARRDHGVLLARVADVLLSVVENQAERLAKGG